VVQYLESLDSEVKALKTELIRMCWFMRGGIGYNEIMAMSSHEREIIGEIIKKNIETTEKTKLPFF
jgi:hypothetical protein